MSSVPNGKLCDIVTHRVPMLSRVVPVHLSTTFLLFFPSGFLQPTVTIVDSLMLNSVSVSCDTISQKSVFVFLQLGDKVLHCFCPLCLKIKLHYIIVKLYDYPKCIVTSPYVSHSKALLLVGTIMSYVISDPFHK